MEAVCQIGHAEPRYKYQARRPEKSVLHKVVREHVSTLFAEAELRSPYGMGYPAHVKREFERLLTCGQFCCGFARLRCQGCGHEQLVPFSCKAKALCPSCVGRRMAETAAYLVDEVMPQARWRQWTFSVPKYIRLLLAREPKRLSKVVTIFLRAVFAYQRRQAKKLGIDKPLCGSVSLLQMFGSILQLSPHSHSWLPDGVFYLDADDKMQFQWLPPPEPQDVAALLSKIRKRVLAVCDTELAEPDDDQMALASDQAQAVGLYAHSETARAEVSGNPAAKSAYLRGFSLHAGLATEANNRKKLERLLRYGMRPAIATRRLSLSADGKVRLKLRKPYYTGQTDVLFEPVEFLRRLAAIIPQKGQNTVRYHGVFAPHAKHHAAVRALVPRPEKTEQGVADGQSSLSLETAPLDVLEQSGQDEHDEHQPSTPKRGYRLLWAELLRRTFSIDVLQCKCCKGRLKLIALVKDPVVICKICDHLGKPTELLPVAPARPPPQSEFEDFDPIYD